MEVIGGGNDRVAAVGMEGAGGWKAVEPVVMSCLEVSCDGDVVLLGNCQSVVSPGNYRGINCCVAVMIWITLLSP